MFGPEILKPNKHSAVIEEPYAALDRHRIICNFAAFAAVVPQEWILTRLVVVNDGGLLWAR